MKARVILSGEAVSLQGSPQRNGYWWTGHTESVLIDMDNRKSRGHTPRLDQSYLGLILDSELREELVPAVGQAFTHGAQHEHAKQVFPPVGSPPAAWTLWIGVIVFWTAAEAMGLDHIDSFSISPFSFSLSLVFSSVVCQLIWDNEH